MSKRIIAGLLSIVLTLTVFPEGAFAGEKADYVQELSHKSYILNLVGGDDAAAYRSGAALSANMNAAQVEQCLDELLNTELEGTLNDLENIALYGQQKNNEALKKNANAINYDEALGLLNDLRKVRSEVKGCLDIISSNRSYIKNAMKAFEQGNVYSNEHETEAAANQVIVRTDELEKQISNAASLYAGWKESVTDAKERIIAATNPNAKLNASTDALQRQIVRLKTGRAAEVERLAAAEKASSQSQDIVIDVVSINEIRIYALDKDREALRNATV
ncbi:MAG: hypothetical protein KBS79_03775 [Lachnospiraceae bacterium]|nr:hypothetical protein [Candidatus Minthocola equi]